MLFPSLQAIYIEGNNTTLNPKNNFPFSKFNFKIFQTIDAYQVMNRAFFSFNGDISAHQVIFDSHFSLSFPFCCWSSPYATWASLQRCCMFLTFRGRFFLHASCFPLSAYKGLQLCQPFHGLLLFWVSFFGDELNGL